MNKTEMKEYEMLIEAAEYLRELMDDSSSLAWAFREKQFDTERNQKVCLTIVPDEKKWHLYDYFPSNGEYLKRDLFTEAGDLCVRTLFTYWGEPFEEDQDNTSNQIWTEVEREEANYFRVVESDEVLPIEEFYATLKKFLAEKAGQEFDLDEEFKFFEIEDCRLEEILNYGPDPLIDEINRELDKFATELEERAADLAKEEEGDEE